VAPVLDRLQKLRFRMDPETRQAVLRLAGGRVSSRLKAGAWPRRPFNEGGSRASVRLVTEARDDQGEPYGGRAGNGRTLGQVLTQRFPPTIGRTMTGIRASDTTC
jgi:hypothetical protein